MWKKFKTKINLGEMATVINKIVAGKVIDTVTEPL